MANYYTDQLQDPTSTNIREMEKSRPTRSESNSITYNPSQNLGVSWSKVLDDKYNTTLMAEKGIADTDGTSIVNNIAGQYADAVRTNAPVVQRNANIRANTMQGLLGQAKQQATPAEDQPTERAQLRQRRQSSQRYQGQRHQIGG